MTKVPKSPGENKLAIDRVCHSICIHPAQTVFSPGPSYLFSAIEAV